MCNVGVITTFFCFMDLITFKHYAFELLVESERGLDIGLTYYRNKIE